MRGSHVFVARSAIWERLQRLGAIHMRAPDRASACIVGESASVFSRLRFIVDALDFVPDCKRHLPNERCFAPTTAGLRLPGRLECPLALLPGVAASTAHVEIAASNTPIAPIGRCRRVSSTAYITAPRACTVCPLNWMGGVSRMVLGNFFRQETLFDATPTTFVLCSRLL